MLYIAEFSLNPPIILLDSGVTPAAKIHCYLGYQSYIL
jgi:hypothetical protein